MRDLPTFLAWMLLGTAASQGVVSAASAPPQPAHSASVSLAPVLSPQVAALVRQGPRGGVAHTGLLVTDLTTGKALEALRPDELFIPASTTKLLSLGALLNQRGPQSWYSVDVTAPAAEVASRTPHLSYVTLRGSADPSFDLDGPYSLQALAQQIAGRGIKQIDEVRLFSPVKSDTWPAQPLLGTPVTGLRLASLPGWNASDATYQQWVRAAFIRRLKAQGVQVNAASNSGSSGYGTQVAAKVAAQWPRQLGMLPTPDTVQQAKPLPDQGIATVRSAPLITLITRTMKPSDNLWAEQLGATLGQKQGPLPVTHATEMSAIRAYLRRVGANTAGLSLNDASGLSRLNRVTPRTLHSVLARAYALPILAKPAALTPEQAYAQHKNLFIEALPVAGTGSATASALTRGGTMSDRLKGTGLDVRAKTGTLPGVSSLAGYVRAKSGHLLAFSIMLDNTRASTLELRAFQDRLVRLLAQLH